VRLKAVRTPDALDRATSAAGPEAKRWYPQTPVRGYSERGRANFQYNIGDDVM